MRMRWDRVKPSDQVHTELDAGRPTIYQASNDQIAKYASG